MINKFFLFVSALVASAILPNVSLAADWYFPIADEDQREQFKAFGQYFDKSFYRGKESVFPAQYTGYHAATDWEIFSDEEDKTVPVYAVTDGKISFKGPVNGYGGLILLNLADDSHTALYGHLELNSSPLKVGDSVKAGQFLADLGKAFSSETGGERKHLHFGMYNGKDAYFKGYETSQQAIQSKWVDPGSYLKEKGAIDISGQLPVDSEQKENKNQNTAINNNNQASLSTSQISSPTLLDRIKIYVNNITTRLRNLF